MRSRCTRDEDHVLHPHRAAIAGERLPDAACRDAHAGAVVERQRFISRGDACKMMAQVSRCREEGRLAVFITAIARNYREASESRFEKGSIISIETEAECLEIVRAVLV